MLNNHRLTYLMVLKPALSFLILTKMHKKIGTISLVAFLSIIHMLNLSGFQI